MNEGGCACEGFLTPMANAQLVVHVRRQAAGAHRQNKRDVRAVPQRRRARRGAVRERGVLGAKTPLPLSCSPHMTSPCLAACLAPQLLWPCHMPVGQDELTQRCEEDFCTFWDAAQAGVRCLQLCGCYAQEWPKHGMQWGVQARRCACAGAVCAAGQHGAHGHAGSVPAAPGLVAGAAARLGNVGCAACMRSSPAGDSLA